ncbi:MAG: DUF1634 domain-containing protein [Planctomycetia bacterium]|nr:DUF1634 domain-containing protein [Planctomycetia bacterium]
MPETPNAWTDERIDQMLGNLLRTGVVLASVIVVLGGVLFLMHDGTQRHDYSVFRGEPREYRQPTGIVADALKFDSRGIIMLGVLVLLATPFARVVFSLVTFAIQRDPIYCVVTAIVLVVLSYSLFYKG